RRPPCPDPPFGTRLAHATCAHAGVGGGDVGGECPLPASCRVVRCGPAQGSVRSVPWSVPFDRWGLGQAGTPGACACRGPVAEVRRSFRKTFRRTRVVRRKPRERRPLRVHRSRGALSASRTARGAGRGSWDVCASVSTT